MVSASSIVLVDVSLLLLLCVTSTENCFFPAIANTLPVSEQLVKIFKSFAVSNHVQFQVCNSSQQSRPTLAT